MQLGIVGLGKMGGDLALQCLDKGIDVVGHAKHGHPALEARGLRETDFDTIPPYVDDTGEVNWLVQVAIEKEIAVPIIALSILSLFQSRDSGQDSNRAVALLRHEYGGQPSGKDEAIVKERKTSRITKI